MSKKPSADAEPQLTLAERTTTAMLRALNHQRWAKRAQYAFLDATTRNLCRVTLRGRVLVHNAEWLREQPGDGRVMLVMNHRSFFDAFTVMYGIFERGAKWTRQLFFPVRSSFFYEGPLGIALNLLVGAGTLYPPMFREAHKAAFNKLSVDELVAFLQMPQTVVGVHPEGRRNVNDDPYKLLPAHPGAGQIALLAKPMIVPVFVNGLGNDFLGDARRTYQKDARRNHPHIIVYGSPIDYDDLQNELPRPTLYKKLSDRMMEEIRKLGEIERDLRARCKNGEPLPPNTFWL